MRPSLFHYAAPQTFYGLAGRAWPWVAALATLLGVAGLWVGFAVAVAASAILAPARIAAASGLAFRLSQMLDIAVFDRLRQSRWWRAPLIATVLAAVLDTGVFWGVGFAGEDLPWVTWALGDLGVKLVMAVCLLLPFRLLIGTRATTNAAPTA